MNWRYFFESKCLLLIKIDAENYEPLILRALSGLIMKYRPEIILEVLPPVADAIETSPCLSTYNRFLITTEGPKRFAKIEASVDYRDRLLRPTGTQKVGPAPSCVRETRVDNRSAQWRHGKPNVSIRSRTSACATAQYRGEL